MDDLSSSSPYYSTYYGSYEPQDQGGGCMGYYTDQSQAVYTIPGLPAAPPAPVHANIAVMGRRSDSRC